MIYKPSKLVVPELAYNKLVLKSIKQEDKPPNKKYFNPAEVEDKEFLYIVAKIYTAKDCNSILKYIETKSAELINNEPPATLNKIITR